MAKAFDSTLVPLTCTPREAAARLGLGRDAVYFLCRSGQLPAYRLGRSYKIPVAQLESWLAEQVAQDTAKRRAEFDVEQGVG